MYLGACKPSFRLFSAGACEAIPRSRQQIGRTSKLAIRCGAREVEAKYGWEFDGETKPTLKGVQVLPLKAIRRPLGRTRANDSNKVAALMESISERGLQEPIDVLEVEGAYYGFSGCHRFEAHQRLGKTTIECHVRKANKQTLKMHLM